MVYEIEMKIKDYASLYVYTNFDKLKLILTDNNSQIKKTIPITEVKCKQVDKSNIKFENSIVIIDSEKKNMYYEKKSNTAFLMTNENDLRFEDFVYIALPMFSKILAENDKFLLHSSSLLLPANESIVLIGDANAGKTSLAYEMMSNYKCKLISNDHTVIGIKNNEIKTLGGTKDIQMRLGAIELFFPDLNNKIKLKCGDKWNKKLIVNNYIDKEMILDKDNDETKIKSFFSINTADSGETFIRKKKDIDEFLFAYESFSKIIKGTYNYITGFNFSMPSMETEENMKKLDSLCKKIVDQTEVFEAKGSIKYLAKKLVKRDEK